MSGYPEMNRAQTTKPTSIETYVARIADALSSNESNLRTAEGLVEKLRGPTPEVAELSNVKITNDALLGRLEHLLDVATSQSIRLGNTLKTLESLL